MCGISGVFALTERGKEQLSYLKNAISRLNKRGPDNQNVISLSENKVGLAHARLSIIDTSDSANQPMQSYNGKYTIVFNGEIYNYKELKNILKQKGETFVTNGDTEVILKMYHHYGEECVKYFNGFFAFAIFDKDNNTLFIARDRIGIKPLFYTVDKDNFIFASEMKALMAFNFDKKLDYVSLKQYFQFNYIPYPNTIFEQVKKLEPGHTLFIKNDGSLKKNPFYTIPKNKPTKFSSYEDAQTQLKNILEKSVQNRLVSDVPLGSFLSGGIDSSVIATLAAKHKPNLNTFSIGFKDQPYFDETEYANLVAKKIKSTHTVFSLTNNDLYENLHNILDYIDEPFADSSAIPVYILSKKTREKVTVSLSGDGADELFGGYNKHFAEWRVQQQSIINKLVKTGAPLWKALPKSRHSKLGNLFRQLDRFATGAKMNMGERYLRWCAFSEENYAEELLLTPNNINNQEYTKRKESIISLFNSESNINDILYADMHQVLVNDMLVKVDLMSMANSLEVRVPFLDHNVVDFAFSLPANYKVSKEGRKRILKDAFRNDLPQELYNRNKMGFEVPLLQWFQTDLKSMIIDDLLSDKFIEEQQIFNPKTIEQLKKQLFSNNPGEVHAKIWALIVFQYWWKKYMM